MLARATAAAWLAVACGAAAQQASPPAPAFAAPNLTPAGVRALAASCAPCHGTDGHAAPGSTVASLAARPAGDIAGSMALYREGRKPATVMQQISKGFRDDELEALDAYFARQKPRDDAPK